MFEISTHVSDTPASSFAPARQEVARTPTLMINLLVNGEPSLRPHGWNRAPSAMPTLQPYKRENTAMGTSKKLAPPAPR